MKISILSSAWVKICQLPHDIFKTPSSFFFKFFIIPQCQVISVLFTFLDQTLNASHKRNQSKCKILRLSSAQVKILTSLIIFELINHFFRNSASLFSVMRHNSSVLFQMKFYILSTKGAYQSTNLVKFYVSSQKSVFCTLWRSFCPNYVKFQLIK